MTAPVPTGVARHAQNYLKQPSPGSMPAFFEAVEPSVGHDEHLLRTVFDVRFVDPQTSQVSPHEVDVCLVESPEAPGSDSRLSQTRQRDRREGGDRRGRGLQRGGVHRGRMAAGLEVRHQSLHESESSARADQTEESTSDSPRPPWDAALMPTTARIATAKSPPSSPRKARLGPIASGRTINA